METDSKEESSETVPTVQQKCTNWTFCKHPKCVRETDDAERYECDVCGEKWSVYYDEVK